jgi:protocatechuate 3,4-dioxygenase beta subunit
MAMKPKIFLIIFLFSIGCMAQTAQPQDKDISWSAVLSPKEERGEALVVSGRVFGPDGKAPVAGATVYVYHTDIHGYYNNSPSRGSENPRLRGWMRTDAEGKYEYRTIKPGPYPSSRIPAHIHYRVSAPGYKERVFEIVFEGDPFITEQIRADAKNAFSVYAIQRLERDGQNTLRCAQDVTLQRE